MTLSAFQRGNALWLVESINVSPQKSSISFRVTIRRNWGRLGRKVVLWRASLPSPSRIWVDPWVWVGRSSVCLVPSASGQTWVCWRWPKIRRPILPTAENNRLTSIRFPARLIWMDKDVKLKSNIANCCNSNRMIFTSRHVHTNRWNMRPTIFLLSSQNWRARDRLGPLSTNCW